VAVTFALVHIGGPNLTYACSECGALVADWMHGAVQRANQQKHAAWHEAQRPKAYLEGGPVPPGYEKSD
jgi:hypothetical protein